MAGVTLFFMVPADSVASCDPPPLMATPKYELIEIDILGFEPDIEALGRFGINNRGEIAYAHKRSGPFRAMLYLPSPAYGFDLSQSSLIDLTDVFGTTAVPEEDGFLYGASFARDISDHGFIVGQSGGSGRFEGKAFVIDLADHFGWPNQGLAWQPAALINPCESTWARAMAVSDGVDPVVVVERGVSGQCLFGLCDQDTGPSRCFAMAGFLTGLNGDPLHTLLGNVECPGQTTVFPSTFAYDIERSLAGSALLYAATTDRHTVEPVDPPNECGTTSGGGCWELTLAIRGSFQVSGSPQAEILSGLSSEYAPVARGINRVGDTVGWGLIQPGGLGSCIRHAALWPSEGTGGIDLHARVSEVADQSQAEAVNRFGSLPHIVGWDRENRNPLLWTKDGDDCWHGWVLQVGGGAQHAIIECDDCDQSGQEVFLREALDINDRGWIIAWGERGDPGVIGDSAYRLYLLKPLNVCGRPGDLDQSGEVNLTDLTRLLGAWGDCEHL